MLFGKDFVYSSYDGTKLPNTDKKMFIDIWESFEKEFKENHPNDVGYFSSPVEMITTFMEEKGVHELNDWLEEVYEEFLLEDMEVTNV